MQVIALGSNMTEQKEDPVQRVMKDKKIAHNEVNYFIVLYLVFLKLRFRKKARVHVSYWMLWKDEHSHGA